MFKKKQKYQKRIKYNFGLLHSAPDENALAVYSDFLKLNPNHLGNWSRPGSHPDETEKIERDLVFRLADLYGDQLKSFEGYVSSGATEGNIFCAWLGRQKMQTEMQISEICMLTNDLSHYSLSKAASVVGIDDFRTTLTSDWVVDPESIYSTVGEKCKQGYRGFLIPLTAGYTKTGTSDDVEAVVEILEKIKIGNPNILFHVWVDAALNGLTEPFCSESFKPLSKDMVSGLVVDFHKFGGVPYPASVVLYRASEVEIIDNKIGYLPHNDCTLLGSRSGAPAAAMWQRLNDEGSGSLINTVQTQVKNKSFFMENLQKIFPDCQIINNEYSISCGVIFSSLKEGKLPQTVEKKYWLYPGCDAYTFSDGNIYTGPLYTFYFLPHVTKETTEELLSDLSAAASSI